MLNTKLWYWEINVIVQLRSSGSKDELGEGRFWNSAPIGSYQIEAEVGVSGGGGDPKTLSLQMDGVLAYY